MATLTDDIVAADTEIPVDGSAPAPGTVLKIEDELGRYDGPVRTYEPDSGIDDSAWTVTRGWAGTTAADHADESELTEQVAVYADSSTAVADVAASAALILSGLPTEDPEDVGALWNDAGVLTASAG